MDATLVTALLLGLIGCAVLVYILRTFFCAVVGDSQGLGDKFKLKRKERLLADADLFLKSSSFREAANALQHAFMFDHIRSAPPLIDAAVNLHLSILSRLIMISERKGSHLENLAVVEDLIHTRGELLHAFLDTVRERGALRKKRSDGGKSFPDWAFSEYDHKLTDLTDKIQTNRRSLETQVARIFSALETIHEPGNVTYH